MLTFNFLKLLGRKWLHRLVSEHRGEQDRKAKDGLQPDVALVDNRDEGKEDEPRNHDDLPHERPRLVVRIDETKAKLRVVVGQRLSCSEEGRT